MALAREEQGIFFSEGCIVQPGSRGGTETAWREGAAGLSAEKSLDSAQFAVELLF